MEHDSNQEKQKRLRVLHVISGDRWAGAEVQVFTLIKHLAIDSKLDIHVVIMNNGELADRLRLENIDITILDEAKYNGISLLSNLFLLIRRLQPDLVHTHRQKENVLGSIASLFGKRTCSIRTVHGAPEFTRHGIKSIQNMLDILTGKYIQKRIIAVSEDLAIKLESLFYSSKITTIVNGIDITSMPTFSTPADFRIGHEDKTHVGLVGRLDPVKRVDIFLSMAVYLIESAPEIKWHFHIFGEGTLLEQLQKQVVDLCLDDNQIKFHGHRTDIQHCIASLDVMVMPSDHEGLPMAALEAIVLGTPLVAHNVGGLTDLLSETPCGLVDQHSPEAYANSVKLILSTGYTAPKLKNKYLAEENAKVITELYRSLVR